MAEIIYPTRSISLKGPWLIDTNKLEELDRIMEGTWKKLLERREQEMLNRIEEKVNEEKKEIQKQNEEWMKKYGKRKAKTYGLLKNMDETEIKEIEDRVRNSYVFTSEYTKPEKIFRLVLGSRNIVKASSYEEAAKHPGIEKENPVAFHYRLQCGDVKIHLSVYLEIGSPKLEYDAKPDYSEELNEIYFQINDWVDSIKPPMWQKIFRIDRSLLWFIVSIFIMFSAMIIYGYVLNPSNQYQKQLKSEAYELLKNGTSKENINKAVEILLALNVQYYPPDYKLSQGLWFDYLTFYILILLICILISIRPKIVIGIGKGKTYLKRWRLYLKLTFITIPTIILLNVLLPILLR